MSGETAVVPAEVMAALDRMSTPLDKTVLRGATADSDALCMTVIRQHVMSQPPAHNAFQARVQPWLMSCFGEIIAGDREERNHRFLEEALELVQSCGCTASEAHQLVDYVYGRPVGVPPQEVGGVMVTLAALCLANTLNMHAEGETELARISTPEMTEKIRAKQAAKPKYSPLPVAPIEHGTNTPEAVFHRTLKATGKFTKRQQGYVMGAFRKYQAALPPTDQADPAPAAAKRLIGWRTSDYVMETSDPAMAKNWEVHHEMLPIFEGDVNTKLSGVEA